MLYKAVVPYAVFWKDKLFYSHAIMNTVLSRGEKKKRERGKKHILLHF